MSKYRRVIFTSDVYKIDDRSEDHRNSPQAVNVRWLKTLFADIIKPLTDAEVHVFTGEEADSALGRNAFFRALGGGLDSSVWAQFYDGPLPRAFEQRLIEYFQDALVIGFELPPYFRSLIEEAGSAYLDFSIHPVRFMTDYMFGLRTNDADLWRRVFEIRVQEEFMFQSARLSKARSGRREYEERPDQNSAMFAGQIEVDASLICAGRVWGLEDLEMSLISLRKTYGTVYYKPHPHRTDMDGVLRVVESIRGVELIEENIYDLLASDEVSLIAGFSSGTLHEAKYFGKETKRFIPNRDAFSLDEQSLDRFVPLPKEVMNRQFWTYLAGEDEGLSFGHSGLPEDALKFALIQRWGR